jgi:ATP-dependent helicase/nuclease subunit A
LLQLATAARAARLPWLEVLVDGAGGVDAAALPPALARAAGLLRRWQALLHRLTPHELLDRIVQEGELLPRLAAAVPPTQRAAALHAVQAFVAAALHDEGGRLASAYGLLRALRAGRLRAFAAEPAGAVQLLTVHGAKGLEARAVLVADCDPEARPAERALVLVDWPVGDAAPRRVAFVRDQATLAPSLRALWDGNEAAIEREETNGLYVAATRAREWLVLSCTEPYQRRVGAAPSWWHRMHRWATLWEPPQAAADVDGELAGGVDGATSVPVPQLPALLPHLRAATEAPAAAPARSDERAARLGTAVHRVLEWSGSGALAAARGDLAAASRAAAHEAGLAAADAAAVQAIAARVLASPDCARFFSGPQLRWAGNEVPLAWQGALLRLDRLVALASPEGAGLTWWVLDYKLTHDPRSDAALHEQLARYVAAVRALQPGDAVRGAFITGAGELVEVTGL